ncbi:uncharacterized protein EV420DRAFT_1478280 [Desarmillaria tabescens]|uniref:Uncharacterized protein n=1 Tax=Armillaria tabescens TaxID=1929756 RepID=A0AA39N7L0_ARMTA|nr:uncharacterized protein EV420DRAFT_1478280 [Desarmillaria tabescens]KAK0460507.1 hypothetical protein EV420DRAFT_1478280 [Desarmillaria tabescens]
MKLNSYVPLECLTTVDSADSLPALEDYYFRLRSKEIYKMEFYWGLSRGKIEQESHLNRVQLRSDMKQLLENEEWTLIPTDETLQRIYDLQDYNQECCPDIRRMFTNAIPVQDYTYTLLPTTLSHYVHIIFPNSSTLLSKHHPSTLPLLKVASPVHPCFVVGATYHLFNRFSKLRNRLMSSVSSFYLLQLPSSARGLAEWRPHDDVITRTPRRQRAFRLREPDLEVMPLLLGLPQTLPVQKRSARILLACAEVDVDIILVNDNEIGEYAYEPVQRCVDVLERGDEWKRVVQMRLLLRRREGISLSARWRTPAIWRRRRALLKRKDWY